jgi:hypothetical protein
VDEAAAVPPAALELLLLEPAQAVRLEHAIITASAAANNLLLFLIIKTPFHFLFFNLSGTPNSFASKENRLTSKHIKIQAPNK